MANTYLGSEQQLVNLWLEARFAANAAALNAINAGLSSRIFPDFAPFNAAYPFIVYQAQSPPRDVRGVGAIRLLVDTLYVVKAVAQVDTYAPLAPVATLIDSIMIMAAPQAVSDGTVLCSTREDQFSLVEVNEGKQFRHLGGSYRILAQATA